MSINDQISLLAKQVPEKNILVEKTTEFTLVFDHESPPLLLNPELQNWLEQQTKTSILITFSVSNGENKMRDLLHAAHLSEQIARSLDNPFQVTTSYNAQPDENLFVFQSEAMESVL